jgi:adenosylcobinamide amidohydrolase
MSKRFEIRLEPDALIVSFASRVPVLSWAVLNGGMCYADHVVNCHVRGDDDAIFCAEPGQWLKRTALELGLQGKVVALATAVPMKNLIAVSLSSSSAEITCFATVGCANALCVGDPAVAATAEAKPSPLHTINIIVMAQPGLSNAAMVEAIQIVTEGRVRALYEAGIPSSVSTRIATGTGTDCIAIVSLDGKRLPYCGKHTRLGELIGSAVHEAVKKGLAQGSPVNPSAPGGNSHDQ